MSNETARVRPVRVPTTIPPLKDLQYDQCGFTVIATFTADFVRLHRDDWDQAERDWERIVELVLNTDAVERRASGGQAVKQAVEAAAAFLSGDAEWPWCPICARGTAVEGKDSADDS